MRLSWPAFFFVKIGDLFLDSLEYPGFEDHSEKK